MARTATTTASFSLSSANLTSSPTNISASTTLTKAASKLGLTDTSGLGVKTTLSVDQYTLFYADQYTADKSSKVYLRNLSTIASEFFLVSIDDEPLGRLYAGDFSFFPWSATDGVRQVISLTLAATWATADTVTFDGQTITGAAAATTAAWVELLATTKYPNWTAAENGGASDTVVLFTAKDSNNLENFQLGSAEVATGSIVATITGNGTAVVAQVTEGVASANDIKITPSVATSMSLEHILINE
tara:strand:+ start:887 stop:1621 length:735 start_codon:yes stop_codon:yes gene_type:complete